MASPRRISADGWTRQIDLTISVYNSKLWESTELLFGRLCRFLTGDYWTLHFVSDQEKPPQSPYDVTYNADCVSLISGGVDSLIGAIDLTEQGKKPIFVSRIVRGDKKQQSEIAKELGALDNHFQWSYKSKYPNASESSTRARSIIFYAYSILTSSVMRARDDASSGIDIIVLENGFISINIALTPCRMGSLSTKTTHPIYLKLLEEVFAIVGIQAKFQMPYKFKTKGEMIQECRNSDKLLRLIYETTSCGKFGRHKLKHCGRCVPCLVRRAAFLKAKIEDKTVYEWDHLKNYHANNPSSDISAVAQACVMARQGRLTGVVGSALRFSGIELPQYRDMIYRGVEELDELLLKHEIL